MISLVHIIDVFAISYMLLILCGKNDFKAAGKLGLISSTAERTNNFLHKPAKGMIL